MFCQMEKWFERFSIEERLATSEYIKDHNDDDDDGKRHTLTVIYLCTLTNNKRQAQERYRDTKKKDGKKRKNI
jgi:hypothetical protein